MFNSLFRKSCGLCNNGGNMADPDRPDDNITRRMRFACWVTKDTDTRSEYVILIVHCYVLRTLPVLSLFTSANFRVSNSETAIASRNSQFINILSLLTVQFIPKFK